MNDEQIGSLVGAPSDILGMDDPGADQGYPQGLPEKTTSAKSFLIHD